MAPEMRSGRRTFLLGAGALVGAGVLGACSGKVYTATATGEPVSQVSIAQAQAAIDAVRAPRGLKGVTPHPTLQRVAEEQAALMAANGVVDHTPAPGETFIARLRGQNFWGAAGENLAGGPPTLAAAMTGWMNSPSHRHTLLNPDYTRFGIAITRGPQTFGNTYGTYWALAMGVNVPEGLPPR